MKLTKCWVANHPNITVRAGNCQSEGVANGCIFQTCFSVLDLLLCSAHPMISKVEHSLVRLYQKSKVLLTGNTFSHKGNIEKEKEAN